MAGREHSHEHPGAELQRRSVLGPYGVWDSFDVRRPTLFAQDQLFAVGEAVAPALLHRDLTARRMPARGHGCELRVHRPAVPGQAAAYSGGGPKRKKPLPPVPA